MIVIGLNGKFRHGKSYLAKHITEEAERQGLRAETVSFAEPLKDLCRREFGWDGVKDARGRLLLQTVGTDAGRSYNENIWVDKWMERVRGLSGSVDLVISDDMRFPNEVDAIESMGGVTCRVLRLNGDATPYIEPGMEHLYSHASEQELKTVRVITCYSGDLDSLRASACELLNTMRRG